MQNIFGIEYKIYLLYNVIQYDCMTKVKHSINNNK